MTLYDCTFILNPQLEETGLEGYIKDARDLVERHGGKVMAEKRMGMRRLAYEIQKLTQGYYVSLVFDGNGSTVHELERHFRLDENCLRFLTCLATKKVVDQVMEAKSKPAETIKPAEEKPVETKPEEATGIEDDETME